MPTRLWGVFLSKKRTAWQMASALSHRCGVLMSFVVEERPVEPSASGSRRGNMPVYLLSDGAGLPRQVPAHLTRIPISLISSSVDCSNRTVQGRVEHKGPLVQTADDTFVLKAVVTEECEQSGASINVVLLGALAQDFSQAVSQGDVVAASGFTVAKSPTHHKDKLHPFNLQLSGDHACVFVFREPPPRHPPASAVVRSKRAASAQASRLTKDPKYTYVRLSELKPGAVVNVYGVVVFFKQPCRTRGTDFCTSLKITDQSNQSVCCNIFCEKLEDHPKIFRIGDIIRLHRVKTQSFNDSVMLINTFGTSVVTFDGEQGGPVEPRTSCRTFHFDQDDSRAVEELRAWRAGRLVVLPSLTPLSAVQPRTFFDLTCQLLAKASMDSSCTLLRVWDGSRCPHPQLKVDIGPDVTEGPWSFSAQKEQLIANILVFDNHVELAKELKPGDFLRIYNLRAIPGSHRLPGLSSSQPAELHHLAFHLHGGTAYGRGIRVLPETCPEVQELKRVLDSFQDDDLHDLLEAWNTPPERPSGAEAADVRAGRRCSHVLCPERLSEVRRSAPGGFHHVRVQLRSFQPSRPHQLLKLYCSKCCSMQDVPDDDLLEDIFSQASRKAATYEPPPWALSGTATLPLGPSVRTLDVHVSKELLDGVKTKQLIFIMGSSLEEALHLTSGYRNVVPVTSSRGHMTLLDLSAPFLFRGRRRYYGCRSCSNVVMRDPCSGGVELMDEKSIAEALGVELMRLVFLMKLELRDATDSLHAYLWRDAELFFGVTAEDAAANQESQSSVCRTLESLCPKEGSSGGRPWLDLCLVSYRAGDDGGQAQTCYQVCHSAMATPS